MNQRSDIDHVLIRWFDDGPTAMPDRVLNVVTSRISVQRQRRLVPLLGGKAPMNRTLLYVAAAAAAIVIALAGWNLLPRQAPTSGGPPPPTPSALPSSAATSEPIPEGVLSGGTYRLTPFSSAPTMFFDATVPAGWGGVPSWGILAPGGSEAPSGLGIGLMRADGLFRDPCHWDLDGTGTYTQIGDIVVGPTVNDLVTALHTNSAYSSSTPKPVTIGGYAGQQLDLQLPSDVDFASCDVATGTSSGVYFVFSGNESGLFAQGPGNRWQVSVLDVAGRRVILVVDDYAGTPPAVRAAAQTIVNTLVISP